MSIMVAYDQIRSVIRNKKWGLGEPLLRPRATRKVAVN